MIYRIFWIVIAGFLLLSLTAYTSDQKPYSLISVDKITKDQYQTLTAMRLDIVRVEAEMFEIVVTPADLERLQQAGIPYELKVDDLTEFYRTRLNVSRDMGGYKTLDEIYTYLDGIISDHGDIISSKVDIGQTIEDRTMWAVKISDNPLVNEDEPEVFFSSAIHAREVITPEVVFRIMDHLTDNYGSDPAVTELVDNRELWFVVVVNPDGYYHNQVINPGGGGMWRKNRRDNGDGTWGVDLNRNYSYEWGYDDNGSSPYTSEPTYRGTMPFSEPETQNIRDFIIAHNFVITLYYHSYSNLVLWPWGYDYFITPDNDIFSVLGDSMVVSNGYDPGPAHGLYPCNGVSDDWGYGEQTLKNKNFALTVEVGSSSDGFWPSLDRVEELVSENLEPALFLARISDNIYKLRKPEAPELFVDDTVDGTLYNIDWSLYDTLNPAVYYELVEMQDFQRVSDSANNFDNWENNQFSLVTNKKHSQPTSFYSGADNNSTRYVQTISPLAVGTGDSLIFWAYYDIETNWDYAYVEVSTDGENFTPIPGNITTDYDPNGNNRGNGITGFSSGWIEGLFDLADYVGQEIQVRISYYTDSYVLEEGIYIDDIYPVDGYGTVTVISSTLADTTYAFTSKPIGSYFYKVRAQDAEDQWGAFSSIRETYVNQEGFVSVLSTTPDQNELNVVYSTNIEASFSEDMDELSIGDSSFIVNALFSGPHFGSVTYDDLSQTATLNPSNDFNPGEVVTISLTNAIQSSGGIPLVGGYSWSFTTAVSSESPGSFVYQSAYAADHHPWSITAADLDGDFDLDLAVVADEETLNDYLTVLLNDGEGNFVVNADYEISLDPLDICASDLDGDGDVDLVAAGAMSDDVSVLLNNGDGTFAAPSVYAAGGWPFAVKAADLDGDGDQDLITAGYNSGDVSILPNNGDGSFDSPVAYPVGNGPSSVSVADFDNDGYTDIAVANAGDDSVAVLLNAGDGSFISQQTCPAGIYPLDVCAADLDGDGIIDLVSANSQSADVSVLIGNGDGSFAPQVVYAVGDEPWSVYAADLNGDDILDLITANFTSSDISVLEGNGDGTFGVPKPYAVGYTPKTSLPADLDGDGDIDLITQRQDSVVILWNKAVICGDINGDGTGTDIADMVYLVEFMFNGGTPPPMMETTDVDGSGEGPDISDLIYLMNYMFHEGPEPNCP